MAAFQEEAGRAPPVHRPAAQPPYLRSPPEQPAPARDLRRAGAGARVPVLCHAFWARRSMAAALA